MVPLEGPVGVGALVDGVLLGCALVQSCIYYKNSREDAWSLKGLVSLILLLLLSHLGCLAAWVWAASELNEDASEPPYAAILFGISNIFGTTVLLFERCFFAIRILKTSNNHFLVFTFFILCIFTFTAALGASTVFFTSAMSDLTTQLSSGWVFPLAILSGLVCDLVLSATTAFYLKQRTPSESIGSHMGTISRLIFMVAETGFATSFVGVAVIITYWLTRTNYAWVGLLVMMPGVFANTFLAALNARGRLVADIEHQRTVDLGEKLIDKRAKRPPIVVTISKQVENHSESGCSLYRQQTHAV